MSYEANLPESTLRRLETAYPWPEFHLTLTAVEIIRLAEKLYSSAPMDFLEAHQWDNLASTHTRGTDL